MYFGATQIQHLFRIKNEPRQNQVYMVWMCPASWKIVLHEVNVEWNPDKFIVLGVEFTTDLREITKINLKKKINSIQRELYQWTKRNTPIGKITVIRSLMIANIVHILTALPDPDMSEIKKTGNIIS